MDLAFTPYQLLFKHPFGVSSNTRKETTSIFVRLQAESLCGHGEACLPPYLGETPEETLIFFKKAADFLKVYEPLLPAKFFLDAIDQLSIGCYAAKAALDIAIHDLYAKLAGKSYGLMMGIDPPIEVASSITIGIDSEEKLALKITEAEAFKILKIKAGTKDDKKLITIIRQYTDKPLYVDVNQGWTDKHAVLDNLQWMSEQNVLLVEQPMPLHMVDEMRWVTEQSPIPTIADESVKRLKDLETLNGTFTGVNIKLMKSTGLREALKMIRYCKKNNILVMLGCMAESSCATTAMAHLAGLADFVDLDAPLLYTNDPFEGLQYKDGRLVLPTENGIGLRLMNELWQPRY